MGSIAARRCALAMLVAFVVMAAPARAQRAQGRDSVKLAEARRRAFEQDVDRLRRQVDALQREYTDARSASRLRAADSVLQRMRPERDVAIHELARVQGLLSSSSTRMASDPEFVSLVTNLAMLQARTEMEGSASQAPYGFSFDYQYTPTPPKMRMRQTMPSGYMGVSYSSSASQTVSNGEVIIEHADYPVIESVEPGSPADRAGLEASDTIIAYNGVDVRNRRISLSKLLQPGTKVVVRVRRDDATRDIPVTIGRRTGVWVMDPTPSVAPVPQVMPAPRAPWAARAPTAPVAPPFILSTGTSACAGAELATISHDLGEAFGVDRGLLVINVAAGSPAQQSGLRAGDVILEAEGRAVTTPVALQRIVERASDRNVSLQIVRRKSTRTVTLRW